MPFWALKLNEYPIFYLLAFFFFFTLGSEPRIYVMSFWALKLNEYPIFYLLAFFFFYNCVSYAAMPELTWIGGYMALFEQLSSSKTELLRLHGLICLS